MRQFAGDIHEWESVLAPLGVTPQQMRGVMTALHARSIEASEVTQLVREYGRLGPHAPRPFPGFGFGDEQEVAAELEIVRENLRDAMGINKEAELKKNRVWYEA